MVQLYYLIKKRKKKETRIIKRKHDKVALGIIVVTTGISTYWKKMLQTAIIVYQKVLEKTQIISFYIRNIFISH